MTITGHAFLAGVALALLVVALPIGCLVTWKSEAIGFRDACEQSGRVAIKIDGDLRCLTKEQAGPLKQVETPP